MDNLGVINDNGRPNQRSYNRQLAERMSSKYMRDIVNNKSSKFCCNHKLCKNLAPHQCIYKVYFM